MEAQSKFKRVEQKYCLNPLQYEALLGLLQNHLLPDRFAESAIGNIYYDTPDHRLIRTSLDKPVYKEKLRLRCYAIPQSHTPAFVELKKKYKGVVYKRRVALPYKDALRWLAGEDVPFSPQDQQIAREIEWFLQFYTPLIPAMALFYHRFSYCGAEDPSLRITFDHEIRWRTSKLDLACGDDGTLLFERGEVLMEVKAARAFPLWLTAALTQCNIYPTSYSKYGMAYRAWKTGCEQPIKGGIICA